MNASFDWKKALMDSGLPMNHETAKMLVNEGFMVDSDFKYARNQGSGPRDHAIDLDASIFTLEEGMGRPVLKTELLVKCSPRPVGALWIMMPDPNQTVGVADWNLTPFQIIDHFSPFVTDSDIPLRFQKTFTSCQKGFEISGSPETDGTLAVGKGLEALQFALPRVVTNNTLFFMLGPPASNLPFLFCPVLLTSTPLFVLKGTASTSQIESAGSIEDVAEQVPFIRMHREFGPDFETHCRMECERLKILQGNDQTRIIEQSRARYFNSRMNLPFTIIDALISGERHYLRSFFSEFVVCTLSGFPELLKKVKDISLDVSTSLDIIE